MSGESGSPAPGPDASQRDLVLAAKGGGIKFAGAVLTNLGGFLVALVLSRTLGVIPFGQYRLGLTVTDLLARLVDVGFGSAVLRFVPQASQVGDRDRVIGVVRFTCGIPLALGSLFAVFLLFTAEPISIALFKDPSFAPVLQAFALAVPFNALLNSSESLTRSFNRIDYSVIGRDIAHPAVRILATVAVIAGGYGVAAAGYAHVLSLIAGSAVLVYFSMRLVPGLLGRRGAKYPIRDIFGQALPMYLARLLQAFGGRIETLVLGFFGMATGLGIYGAALQLSRLAYVFHESLSAVSLPIISSAYAEGGAGRLRPLLRTATGWSVTVTLPLCVAIVLFAEPLLSLFGADFTEGTTALVILALVPLFNASTSMANAMLAMTGNARLNSINSVVFLGLTLGLDLILIPRYEALGAAVALALTTFLVAVLRLVQVYVLFRIWISGRGMLRAGVAALAATAAVLAFEYWVPLPHVMLQLAIGGSILLGVYVATLTLLGFSEDDRLILDRVTSRFGRNRRR